ncbi:MAG: hypothetical protein MI919_41595 [Holophagales bacterium]|nr:hypothetical protein [Holophagales bacterium]
MLEVELADGRARACLRLFHTTQDRAAVAITNTEAVERARRLVARLLALHPDPSPFEERMRSEPEDPLAAHVARRPGLAVPQTPTAFDGAVWVIAGQQVSLAAAFSIRRRLTDGLGTALPGGELRLPPGPEDVAAASLDRLFGLGLSRRKAEYLQGLASRVVGRGPEPPLELEGLGSHGPADAEETLLGVRGLGPWSVHYLLMRSYGFPDQVPAGDAALARALHRLHGLERRPNAARTRELMERYTPHRSLASFHCWAALADPELASGP